MPTATRPIEDDTPIDETAPEETDEPEENAEDAVTDLIRRENLGRRGRPRKDPSRG